MPSFCSRSAGDTPGWLQALGQIALVRREVPDRLAVAGHCPPVGRRAAQLGRRSVHRIGVVWIVRGVRVIRLWVCSASFASLVHSLAISNHDSASSWLTAVAAW